MNIYSIVGTPCLCTSLWGERSVGVEKALRKDVDFYPRMAVVDGSIQLENEEQLRVPRDSMSFVDKSWQTLCLYLYVYLSTR
jgi:hypothetical protein